MKKTRGTLTRERILKAAYELFVKQGYHGTSMRQIAASSDVALSGLYNHFGSKSDVFHAVFLEYHPYREVIPVLINFKDEDIEVFIRKTFQLIVGIIEERPDFLNLMLIEYVEFNNVHASEISAIWLPQVMPIVESLMKSSREKINPMPPMMLIRSFWGLLFAYYLTEKVLPMNAPSELTENAMSYFVEIYLHGILAQA